MYLLRCSSFLALCASLVMPLLEAQAQTPPANDNFANAQIMSPYTNGTWNGSNVGATVELNEPNHVILPSDASIWFSYTPNADGYVTVDTFGSNFDTALAMYTGSSLDQLIFVAASNDAAGQQSRVSNVDVTAGVTYYIAVDGYFGSIGLATLNWLFVEQFDFTPPVVNLWAPTDGLVLAQDEPLWSGYSCHDPVPSSDLLYCTGNVPSGTLIDTSTPGDYTFTVSAEDGEGNITQINHQYTIVANPGNDDFADAISLPVEGTYSGSNVGATEELSEPFHAGSIGGTSVWFEWTAPVDGFWSADTLGSSFDTLLAIYTGSAVDALTEMDSNDNATGALSAIHNAPVFAGVTYHIVISGAWDAAGDYTLNWTFQDLSDAVAPVVVIDSPSDGGLYFEGVTVSASYYCVDEQLGSGIANCTGDVPDDALIDTASSGAKIFSVTGSDNSGNSTTRHMNYTVIPFSNDDFQNALPISGSGELIATNLAATKETNEPNHAGNSGGASVWFAWTAQEDGFLSVDTLQSSFDTTLAIYTGLAVDTLVELASNNDSLGQNSRIQELPVTMGETYYIAVDGVAGATGQIDFDWVTFSGPTFTEISPLSDPLWVTDSEHDFQLSAAAPADVDGDGDLDLAAIGYLVEYHVGVEDKLVVFMNNGFDAQGNFSFTTQEVPLNGMGTSQAALAWGDLDGDGDPDLAVGAAGSTSVYRNDTGVLVPVTVDLPGYYENSSYSGTYNLRSLTWADYDNDGDLDLLIPSTFDEVASVYTTSLMRNDGASGENGWEFTEANSTLLHGNLHAQTAWADNDGDGDLDLFMANVDALGENGYVRTYRNDDGVFTSTEPLGNLDIDYGLGDWSDYDGDGDLDILIAGNVRDLDGNNKTLLRVYDNVDGVYQPNTIIESSFFPWLDINSATWADYDSDGDVDILLTGTSIGESNIEGRSEVYVNDNGSFYPLGKDLPAPIDASGAGGAFTWFDVDGDGDLDYFVAGAYWVPNGNGLIETQMHLYRNDSISVNALPSAPTGLSSSLLPSSKSGDNTVQLSWMPATDDATPSAAITYDLEIYLNRNNSTALQLRLPQPGNISNATAWAVHGLTPGNYTWVVRAVDSAFNGSPEAIASFSIGGEIDSDSDGIADDADNCTLVANADQQDTDGDGFGNICDPDLNNDNIVNFLDVVAMVAVFFSNDPHADFNGDGVVNFIDYALMPAFLLNPPGPSGIAGKN